MALNSAQSIFNLIRVRASKEYQDFVPALTDKSPIGDVATPILTNPLIFKEFSILLGALLEVEVDKRVWQNPLAELIKSNGRPLGEYSAEVTNNPVTPRQYDPLNPEKFSSMQCLMIRLHIMSVMLRSFLKFLLLVRT